MNENPPLLMKIAVTGANSSVGQNLLAHVAESTDVEAVAGVRSQRGVDSLPVSPRVDARIISYDDVADLAEALQGASVVVHLAGILIENKTTKYASANVAVTAAVVQAAQMASVQHIVLVSVLGASPDSRNRFLRSKGEAERHVTESGMSSTIIRTPILLGPDTAGADSLVRTATHGKAKLLGDGSYDMRPLDIDDLNQAILNACRTRPEGSTTHELVGPESIPYRELVTRFADMMGTEIAVGTIPLWIAKLGATVSSRLKGGGITPTVIDVITASEVVSTNADADLGISLTPLSTTLEKIVSNRK
ncbi:MAG TPA: NAD-dependent epimerase/dehydratase family protein [Gemmatimonadetes bacterium]|nr:NAD-dependent epimerase/dehydratase family protein [Gemmatimonadota bacterium]